MIGEKPFSSCCFVQKFLHGVFPNIERNLMSQINFCDAEFSLANVYLSKGRGYSSDTKMALISEIY